MILKYLCLFVFLGFALFAFLGPLGADDSSHPPTISAGKGGFLITSEDGDFVLRIRGYVQADSRFFFEDQATAIDTFTLRRVRPIFEATVYKYFDIRIMPDFGGGTTVIQDAYLDAKFNPAFKIRFGKTKGPVGLERLQSARDLEFVERSLVTNLVPNRDLGIQVFGDFGASKFNYAGGVFNGVVDGGSSDGDNGQGKDFEGRLFFKPVPWLGFGLGLSSGTTQGSLTSPNLPVYKTSGQQTFFKYKQGLSLDTTAVAAGTRERYSPQLTLYKGRVGILSEYASSSQQVRLGTSAAKVMNNAWNVMGSFVLTGEDASYEGISPKNPFNMETRKFGAFEAVVRFSQLDIDKDAFPIFADPLVSSSHAGEWAIGLNWYLNKNVKFVFDYDRTYFDGGVLKTEDLLITRFQLAF